MYGGGIHEKRFESPGIQSVVFDGFVGGRVFIRGHAVLRDGHGAGDDCPGRGRGYIDPGRVS